jgi:hypothetical protein
MGDIDFIVPDTENWSNDIKEGHQVVYSTPFLTSIDGLLVKADRKDAEITSIKTVGAPMGFPPWAIIDQVNAGDIQVSYNANQQGLLLQVLDDRIYAAYICVSAGMYYAKHGLGRDEELVFAQNMPYSRDEWRLSTIKHPDIIQQFDLWLNDHADWISQKKHDMAVELGESLLQLQKK